MEKTVQNIPFLRFTIALVAGIVAGQFVKVNLFVGLISLLLLLAALALVNLKYKYSFSPFFGIFFNLFFILSGIVLFNIKNQKPEFHSEGIFVATVIESPVEKPKSYKSTVVIKKILNNDSVVRTKENVIVYFEKQEKATTLKPGDEILFKQSPEPVAPKLNPYDFDYRKYLERKKIYRQVYLRNENWIKTDVTHFSLVYKAEQLRDQLVNVYRSQPIDSVEFEILSALTLGYSRELDTETRRVFSSSGAMHVLSVSGLHVAIIFAVINFLFGFLRRNRKGRFVFTVSVLAVLWFYAFITGLSPSVLRAAAMFSVFIIGENIQRKANIFNSLALTAFFLLLINPNNLFDIGFQLSYAALFGIVVIEPKISQKINVKNRILKYFTSLVTVSVAAQIATFPLTSYYFSQFPTYFWLTNIFIIPAVAFLTPAGIGLLFVSPIPGVSTILSILLNSILKISYKLLASIDQMPFSVFQITINEVQLILLTGVLISLFIVSNHFTGRNLKITLSLIFVFSVSVFVTQLIGAKRTAIFVYNSASNPVVHLISGRQNYVISEEKILPGNVQYSSFFSTQKSLGLKKPVMMLFTDSVRNKKIFMKNRILHFNGQTVFLGRNPDENISLTQNHIVINPYQSWLSANTNDSVRVVVTNKRYFSENEKVTSQIYATFKQGAYQKIW